MPITKSAKKALRQNSKRRVFNLKRLNKMKELIKQFKNLIANNDEKKAQDMLPQIYKAIDKATKRGVIKNNTASRKKSRLTKLLHKANIDTKAQN
ncbi:30S ribosomal protein S20 [Patescibacteria group bacterium]